jgi:hypothetical protein
VRATGRGRMAWRQRGLVVLLAAMLIASLAACDGDVVGATWVRDGEFLVVDGAYLRGALVVTGGSAVLAPGSRTEGPVLLAGGALTVDGLVDGEVLAPAGALNLGPWAVIRGDLGVGGAFARHPDAVVEGEVTTGLGLPVSVAGAGGAGAGGWPRLVVQALLTALWAAAWGRLAPRRLRTMGAAATRHAVVALALGALVFVVGLVLAVLMAFTIVLIPASLLVLAAGLLAVGTGWGALGFVFAETVARRRWGAVTAASSTRRTAVAALGGLGVGIALGLVERLPVVGGTVALLVSVAALGAVALTGFGQRAFVPADRA